MPVPVGASTDNAGERGLRREAVSEGPLLNTLYETAEGIQVVYLTAPDEIEALVQVFEAVAADEGWQPGGELRAYPEVSTYFAVTAQKTLVGGLQLVRPSSTGALPIQRVWPEIDPAERQDVAHVAVLALTPEGRGTGELFWLLCVEVWRSCIQNGIEEVWLEATPRLLRWYRLLGWPLSAEGPLRLHWGEECYPCRMSLWEAADAVLKRSEQSALYRRLVALGNRDLPDEVVQQIRRGTQSPAPALTQSGK